MKDDFSSPWQEVELPEFPALSGDCAADAAVVGGGLCGLLCAYELLRAGVKNIVILEARRVCSGTTAHTTGKITSQHRLIYRRLLDGVGPRGALDYARASEGAVARYREIIEAEKIDCDFTPCDAFLYALTSEDAQKLEEEAGAAGRLGIDARVVKECELPFPVAAALQFPRQARFHPLKFARGLLDVLRREGVRIYENSRAVALEDGVTVTRDGRVYAKSTVLCTHYPFVNLRGLYFSRIVQSRSYVLALEGPPPLRGMYLGCAEDGYSFRSCRAADGKDLLLLGGCGHKTGHETEAAHYEKLEETARRLFPGCTVKYRWSAQDCMTNDGIPYAGRYRQMEGNIYLACGFNKWGMTGSMAAARVVARLIASGGEETSVFSPLRSSFSLQAPEFFRQAGDTAVNFLKGYFSVPGRELSQLLPGEGGVVDYSGAKIGAWRDEEGGLHAVDPVCPHMHCPLRWNGEEKTWDCPCHGSRFDADGKVLESPAVHPLSRRGPD
ncbi:MAG TPA: FAD-dependent oxidoreductase [Ruminococcaceae bacterium]|nr:FAD-dependent oxidoreductase [Oscillospiraceae bacterium]HBT90737.1 FAD-dependent oxidoreductase [Oscillospiraceae bacterium]